MSDASIEGLAAALDLQTVRVVRQISEHGSLTAAAEALGYSQPAVSQQLRRFEERTGIALVERVGRGIRLTQSGRVLARHANAVATAIEAAAGELAEIRGLRAGRVRLVAFPSASATLVPRLIAALGAAHPGIAVTYVEAEPPEAVAAVRADRADLAITFSYPGRSRRPAPGERARTRGAPVRRGADPARAAVGASGRGIRRRRPRRARRRPVDRRMPALPRPPARTGRRRRASRRGSRSRPTTSWPSRAWSRRASGWRCCPHSRWRPRRGIRASSRGPPHARDVRSLHLVTARGADRVPAVGATIAALEAVAAA